MNLNCCIIDDEPLALGLLESYVQKTPFLTLCGKYNSALTAMQERSFENIDLLFLDIQMPELDGMEFSKMLGDKVRIVFTAAFEQYALDSYKVNALDYLLKPIAYPDFLQAANKALQWYERIGQGPVKNKLRHIFVKAEYKLVQIELEKILYIEGLRDYVKIYLQDEPQPLVSLMSMKTLEELLPAEDFIRVHRSYIVQGDKIKVIERNRIIFGKQYIPVSDSYKDKFAAFLSERGVK